MELTKADGGTLSFEDAELAGVSADLRASSQKFSYGRDGVA